MFQEQRREKILQLLQENGSCRVKELKELFNVSEPTIRQDLEALEKSNHITRQHGGAYINTISPCSQMFSFPNRGHEEEKERIGKKAAQLVKDGDNIRFRIYCYRNVSASYESKESEYCYQRTKYCNAIGNGTN